MRWKALRSLSCAALLCCASASAFAADLGGSIKDDFGYPSEPKFSWTGIYFGGHAGLIFDGQADYTHRNTNFFGGPGGVYDNAFDGAIGGGHLGLDYQMGAFVLGLEGSYAASNADGNLNFAQYTNDTTTAIDNIWSLTGRLGFATGRFLVYAKAGYASADITAGQNYYPLAPTPGRTFSSTASADGWTAGMGVEYAVTNNLVAGLEFNHTDLGTVRFSGRDSAGVQTELDSDVRYSSVMGRLSYKFGY